MFLNRRKFLFEIQNFEKIYGHVPNIFVFFFFFINNIFTLNTPICNSIQFFMKMFVLLKMIFLNIQGHNIQGH